MVVPDLSGCCSAGDTLDEAIDNIKEAMEAWLETIVDDGESVPEPRSIAEHQANPEFSGWVWAVVPVDLAQLSGKAEHVNITLSARILRRFDAVAQAAGESRSGFIAHLALRSSWFYSQIAYRFDLAPDFLSPKTVG